MKVSVIFTTYNSPDWLEKVLWGFFEQTIKLFHAYRAGFLQKDMYYFLMLSLVFMLIVNLTESYFFYSTGSYLIAFLTAISVSYIWKYQKVELKS